MTDSRKHDDAGKKAYLVFDVRMLDESAYAEYVQQAPALVESYGGRYLVRGGRVHALEGDWTPNRFVIAEFPDLGAARAFYDSPEYQKILPIRVGATDSKGFIVEGISSPKPE